MSHNRSRKALESSLADKESREAFTEQHIREGIAFQLRALRESRGMTQKALAELVGMDQSNISKMEDPNYEYCIKVSTLLRLGAVFDVPLIVHFGTWNELIKWDENISPRKLAPAPFKEKGPPDGPSREREGREREG